MRRLAVVAALAAGAACANMGSPPGGPVRTEPPHLTATSPDSGAVNVRADRVVFQFDATVTNRDIEKFFLISPEDGIPRVRWRRSRVEVRPRDEFRPNTAYTVTLLPGITDLNNNVDRVGKTVIFSTGPTIPRLNIIGRVFNWVSARPAPAALIEAIRLPDSIPYVGVADSLGQFSVGPLDDATYLVRALQDNNRNRAIDAGEAWDTLRVVVQGGSPVVELLAAIRDSLPPRLLTVSAIDSLMIIATFDRVLDPQQSLASVFRLLREDSTEVRIVLASMTRGDTVAARTDSAGRPVDERVAALERQAAGSTAPRPSRPSPRSEVFITVDSLTPMRAGASYRLTATGVRGLTGLTRPSERTFTVDSAQATPPGNAPPARPP